MEVRDPMELHAGRPADRPVNRRKARSRGRCFFLLALSLWLPRARWETETSPGDDGGDMQRRPSAMRVAIDHQSQGHWRLCSGRQKNNKKIVVVLCPGGRAMEYSEGGPGGSAGLGVVEVMKWEGRDLSDDGMRWNWMDALPRILCVCQETRANEFSRLPWGVAHTALSSPPKPPQIQGPLPRWRGNRVPVCTLPSILQGPSPSPTTLTTTQLGLSPDLGSRLVSLLHPRVGRHTRRVPTLWTSHTDLGRLCPLES